MMQMFCSAYLSIELEFPKLRGVKQLSSLPTVHMVIEHIAVACLPSVPVKKNLGYQLLGKSFL